MANDGKSRGCGKSGLRLYIRTFGCQMNVRDSELICGLLKKEGFGIVEDPKDAGIVIINTCSVRQHAEDRVWSLVGEIARLRVSGNPGNRVTGETPFIGVVGCMAQNYKEWIFQRAPEVDFVVGPSDIDKIPGIINKLSAIRYPLYAKKIWETDGSLRPEHIYHTGYYEDKEHAFVVISEGCENYCSYCVVPYVRGATRHRNHADIIREIEEAISKGIKKITLLGQNVSAYKSPADSVERIADSKKLNAIRYPLNAKTNDFIQLLRMVNKLRGLTEFSFLTSHPKDTTMELFETMAECEKLNKWLHLPVQSGSDKILKFMNRGYDRKYYLDLVQGYRRIVKGGTLTSDIIVGFPGELDEDFKDTCDLMQEVSFNAAYLFKYSPRPNTEAAKFADSVPKEEKERRHRLVLELQKRISNK